MTLQEEFAGWLREFDALVRAVDFASARAYFTEDAIGFGTYGVLLTGREELEQGQWRQIWPNIRNFCFRLDQLTCGAEGDLGWLACPWDSDGVRPDGSTFDRPGRATIIFRREGGRWRACHTHFSLYPTR
ncbi:MAG TPA: nuclear transport factor 2 family protein [Dehalococcoidia bacterium]|nr:nuclear transport factor 2 family protein [Dehalococcoidia bacterium]